MSESTAPERPARFALRPLALRIGLVLGTFGALNLGFGAVLDRTRSRCVNRESGLVNNARKAKAEVLILGSSRAKFHYDPELLASRWKVSVFNAGYPGQAIPFNRVVFDLIAAKHRPKAVIVDVMAFGDDMERVHALDAWYFESKVLREMPAGAESAVTASATPDFRIRLWMNLAGYRYSDRVSRNFLDKPHHGETPSFEPLPAGYVEANWRGYDKVFPRRNFPWYRLQLAALVDEIRNVGAEVVLAYSPTFGLGNEGDFTEIAEAVAKEKDVPFVDFTKSMPPRPENKRYFYNGDHLNAEGVAVFTGDVAEKLRPLLPRTLDRR